MVVTKKEYIFINDGSEDSSLSKLKKLLTDGLM